MVKKEIFEDTGDNDMEKASASLKQLLILNKVQLPLALARVLSPSDARSLLYNRYQVAQDLQQLAIHRFYEESPKFREYYAAVHREHEQHMLNKDKTTMER